MTRVAVVGGGMAGAAAALELARRGAEPVLVSDAPGATALGWGTLDVAPAVPGSRRLRWQTPLRDAPLSGADRLSVLVGAYASHPYAVLWRHPAKPGGPDAAAPASPAERVKQAIADLDASLAPHGLRIEGSLDQNRLLVDAQGAVRVADFAFSGPASGDLSAAQEIAWVSIAGLPAIPSRVAVRRLSAELAALGLPPARLRTPVLRGPDALPVGSVARLAAALESDAGFEAFLAACSTLEGAGSARRVWLFPPVLGLGRVGERVAALRERLGGPVAETLGAVPDATAGYRLLRALDAALADASVERHRGRAIGIEARDGRVAGVDLRTDAGASRIPVEAVVLATGRFLSRGLEDGPGGVKEPLLDLPLYDARDARMDGRPARASLRRRYLDAQPLFSAGVRTDARLRPLSTPGGNVLFPNVFVAGDLLGGFDPSRERTGLGVALLSGVLAARSALTEAEAR